MLLQFFGIKFISILIFIWSLPCILLAGLCSSAPPHKLLVTHPPYTRWCCHLTTFTRQWLGWCDPELHTLVPIGWSFTLPICKWSSYVTIALIRQWCSWWRKPLGLHHAITVTILCSPPYGLVYTTPRWKRNVTTRGTPHHVDLFSVYSTPNLCWNLILCYHRLQYLWIKCA